MSRNEVRIIGGMWKGRKLKLGANAAVRPSLGRVRETLFNWLAGQVEGSDCLDLFAGSGALGFEALSRGARSIVLIDNNRNAVEALRRNALRLGAVNCAIRRQPALGFLNGANARRTLALDQTTGVKGTPTPTTFDLPHTMPADSGTPSPAEQTPKGTPIAAAQRTAPRGTPTPPAKGTPTPGSAVDLAAKETPTLAAKGTPTLGSTVDQWDIVFLDPPFASGLLGAALLALRNCNSLRPGARVYFELERRGEVDLEGWTVLKQGTAGDTRFGLLASP